jgi:predicted metal-dependent hydrolase
MSQVLIIDELSLEVRRSARRKHLELIIDRGGELILAAPDETGDGAMVDFVREKKLWLYTKLAEKRATQQPAIRKEFVSGEGFAYLGRNYRLLLVQHQDFPLKLENGRFKLLSTNVNQGREVFVQWYEAHSRVWITKRIMKWAPRLNVAPQSVETRDLGYRWGSCGMRGNLNFHWACILLPPAIVDYVIVHELAHLIESNHTLNFWRIIGRILPDYEQRKRWLAVNGSKHVLL